jgi:hypothetical protein
VNISRATAAIIVVFVVLIILDFRQQDGLGPFSLGLHGMKASQQREKDWQPADVHGFHRKLEKG